MKTIPAFYFDPDELEKLAERQHSQFLNDQPFPHIVIDDFLPPEILNLLVKEFPTIDEIPWTLWGPGQTQHTGNKQREKVGTSDENNFGAFTRHFMTQLNSAVFIRFIEKLTGEKGILPDPTFNGCGLHSTGPGGKLMLHVDTNRHPLGARFHQRYNLIFFLNENWKEEYGGHLELWNESASACVKKILPAANRFVLFDTGTKSFHGHPQPLTCPPERRRNSLAVYYYVLDRSLDKSYKGYQGKVTWIPLSAEDKKFKRLTQAKGLLKKLLPPILFDFKREIGAFFNRKPS